MRLKSLALSLLGFLLVVALSLRIPVSAEPPSSSSIPVTDYQGALVPDWAQISFDTFGTMKSAGTFVAPAELTQHIGFDASVSWNAATPVADVIRLGFLEQAFGLQQLALEQIAQAIGLDVNHLPLEEFGLLDWQTLGSLVEAVPGLANLSISQVPAIAELVGNIINRNGNTIGSLVQDSQIANLALTPILDDFTIGDIPGLAAATLDGFELWQQGFISDVPGLASLTFNNFPIPPTNAGGVALLNLPLSGDGFITNTISGSDVAGFSVPCNQPNCDNLELGHPFLGQRWIVGGEQDVAGGHNLLGNLNGGVEPTGRMFTGNPDPESEPFKLILNAVNDLLGEATLGLAMHWCYHHVWPDPLPNPDCTPYFIEFPELFTYHEQDTIYIGV